MKILLAVDGSKHTKKMLAYLSTHDEMFGPGHRYTVLHVHPPLPARASAVVGSEIARGFYAEETERVTAPVVKFLARHGIEPAVVHKVGTPGSIIAKAADAGKFDLLVMGSHGHGALANLVMGSVATQVLAHCKAPVLLVR
jgi:nucleotide-binding universal stress UspA family protein